MKPKMKNLKTRKLYLQVYDEIKNYIKRNDLQPGDKLPSEMEMCEMLGVSRNVLREAIKSLEITGAVTSTPGVGIVINEFDTDYLFSSIIDNIRDPDDLNKQIEEMRRVLEIGFAKDAYDNLTKREIDLLGEYVNRMKNLAEKTDVTNIKVYGPKFAECDASFHKTLYMNLDNTLLKSIIDFFWACDEYYKVKVSPKDIDITINKHEMIYEAAKDGNYDAFYAAMQFHFNVAYYKR